MIDFKKREISFSLKEYKNNYVTLLNEYLSKHDDFDEKQFIEHEIEFYKVCYENSNLTMYSENGQTKYHLNNGDCKIYIPKIYDSIVNFKKEDDGWDIELALKYKSSFNKILEYLKEKKENLVNIKTRKYNPIFNIASTSEVRNLLIKILNKDISEFNVLKYINENTTKKNKELFLKEFNLCCNTIYNEFMFYITDEDIIKALEVFNTDLVYVYVNEEIFKSIKPFIREYNNKLTVYNITGLSKIDFKDSIKLVYLNDLMIEYHDGFFGESIDGYENIHYLKYIQNILNNEENRRDYNSYNNYNEIQPAIEKNTKPFQKENNYKNLKKIPSKYYALAYMIELIIEKKEPPKDLEGNFKKDEIIKIGRQRCNDSGQNFYNHVKDHFENVLNNTIKNSIFKNWKEIIVEISLINKDNIRNYIQINNL